MPKALCGADGNFVPPIKMFYVSRINNRELPFEFIVLSHCSHDVILGWDFLESVSSHYRLWTKRTVLEDICQDSQRLKRLNFYATGTIRKRISLTRITVSRISNPRRHKCSSRRQLKHICSSRKILLPSIISHISLTEK
ncbi:hypothetical protein TNCV_4275371 [Trichonephila clavipes]|nr:hypothetical protein TNCV_4275371 [Trichonephila clavipes]